MIDFHSHILPGVDDGSKDTQESLKLLDMLKKQGIDTVVATPHFHPDKESVDDFIARRNNSFEGLKLVLPESFPRILLGAEVAYYEGISRLEGLSKLCIGNSRILLIEMPMAKWSQFALDELKTLSTVKGFTIIIAHIERYMNAQSSEVLKNLRRLGILTQVNASFFNKFTTRGKAVRMLINGQINVIGSDCHSVDRRPPCLEQAFGIIRNKAGDEFLTEFTEYQRDLIADL